MKFSEPLLRGTLVKRYKRFLSDIELTDKDKLVHQAMSCNYCHNYRRILRSKHDVAGLVRAQERGGEISLRVADLLVGEGISRGVKKEHVHRAAVRTAGGAALQALPRQHQDNVTTSSSSISLWIRFWIAIIVPAVELGQLPHAPW